jgi:hypothetical protein
LNRKKSYSQNTNGVITDETPFIIECVTMMSRKAAFRYSLERISIFPVLLSPVSNVIYIFSGFPVRIKLEGGTTTNL